MEAYRRLYASPRRKPVEEVPAPLPIDVPANDDEPPPRVRPHVVPRQPQFTPDPNRDPGRRRIPWKD